MSAQVLTPTDADLAARAWRDGDGHSAIEAAAASADRAAARAMLPDPAPRRSTVLLDGVDALFAPAAGDLGGAATRRCGLAAVTVPPDPYVIEPWDEPAATAVAANGDDVRARAVPARSGTPRGVVLAAWLDLRTGRPAGTWRAVAPAVAGADVELLQLDVWGELSVAAAAVSEPTAAHLAEAMDAAITRAGRPPWAVAAGMWWRVQRAAAGTGTTRVEPAPVSGPPAGRRPGLGETAARRRARDAGSGHLAARGARRAVRPGARDRHARPRRSHPARDRRPAVHLAQDRRAARREDAPELDATTRAELVAGLQARLRSPTPPLVGAEPPRRR